MYAQKIEFSWPRRVGVRAVGWNLLSRKIFKDPYTGTMCSYTTWSIRHIAGTLSLVGRRPGEAARERQVALVSAFVAAAELVVGSWFVTRKVGGDGGACDTGC